MRTVLVTGGAGFIGANLVSHLLVHTADILVVDKMTGGRRRCQDPAAAAG